jgi:hypothetical protein
MKGTITNTLEAKKGGPGKSSYDNLRCVMYDHRNGSSQRNGMSGTTGDATGTNWQQVGTQTWTWSNYMRQSTTYYIQPGVEVYRNGVMTALMWGDPIEVPKYTLPRQPTGCSHARVSDTQNTVSWSYSGSESYGTIQIERATNGGSYTQIATSAAGTTSYNDKSTSANNYYQYRVRATSGGGTTSYSTSGTVTYNTPAAPGKPVGARQPDSTVNLTFTNTGRTQNTTQLQRSTDGTNWIDAGTTSGAAVTAMTDNPGAGAYYYRVRNTRSSLVSAWSAASDIVSTTAEPAAPTPLTPVTGSVQNKDLEFVLLSWRHNPVDGSAQTEAEIRYSTDGGENWDSELSGGSAQSFNLTTDVFAVNDTVLWQVRTKGAYAGFGSWSAAFSFQVLKGAQIEFITPTEAMIIQDMPINIEWSYVDESGVQISALLTLMREDKTEVFSKSIQGDSNQTQFTTGEFLPDNNTVYILRLETRSSSSLISVIETLMNVIFVPPAPPEGQINVLEDIGAVSLAAFLRSSTETKIETVVQPETNRFNFRTGTAQMITAEANIPELLLSVPPGMEE